MTAVFLDKDEIFRNAVVSESCSLREALSHMEHEAAIVVSESGKLSGIITDGDLRRALSRGLSFNSPVSAAMSTKPSVVRKGLPREEILSILLSKRIRHLPVVDEEGYPIGLELLKNLYEDHQTKEYNYKECLVSASDSIELVLKHMVNAEAAMIVDENGILKGFVTDGDIRRAFLKGAGLETPVSEVMTASPMTIRKGLSRNEIIGIMLRRKIRHIPVVDELGRPVGLELLKNQYSDTEIPQAVIMAGGRGARLMPLTADTPKPLLKIGEKTILDKILDRLESSGVADVVLSVNYLGDKIKDHVSGSRTKGLHVGYVEEEKALGTAGALSLLSPRPANSFIVMNADLLTNLDFKAFMNFHKAEKNHFTVCVRKIKQNIPFGVVSLDKDSRAIEAITEKPDYEFLVNAGIYILEPGIIELVPKDSFFDMVSLIKKALANGYKVGAFPVIEYWRDLGRHEEIIAAAAEMA